MPQSTILASGTAAGVSTDVVVLAGDVVTLSIFSAAPGASLAGRGLEVLQATPGADNLVTVLDEVRRSVQLSGPATYRVARPALATAFGVSLDT